MGDILTKDEVAVRAQEVSLSARQVLEAAIAHEIARHLGGKRPRTMTVPIPPGLLETDYYIVADKLRTKGWETTHGTKRGLHTIYIR